MCAYYILVMEVLIPELRKELDSIRSQLTSIVKIVDGLGEFICKTTIFGFW